MNDELKKLIEDNIVAFSTVDEKEFPHTIAVAYVKVKDDKIIVTDNYMVTTIENITRNNKVCLCAWSQDGELGYRIKGFASYHQNDEWHEFVKKLPENEGFPSKGAIVIEPVNVTKLV